MENGISATVYDSGHIAVAIWSADGYRGMFFLFPEQAVWLRDWFNTNLTTPLLQPKDEIL